MFVVLEGLKELIVFAERLGIPWFAHVIGAILQFFTPEGDRH